jgi:predicted anti-sigma-YlaC factor YlaD
MNCDRARERIHEAFDDDPPAPLPEDASAHLDGCAACRDLFDDLGRLRAGLRALPRAPLPPAALDAVWRSTVRARPRYGTGFARAAAAAVAVTVLGAGTLFLVTAPDRHAPSRDELAKAEAQAQLVIGYTSRALAATRDATARHVIEGKVSPAVRGEAAPRISRRSS